MKLLLLLTIALSAHFFTPSTPFTEDFEKGFKYVFDNQESFGKMTEDQFIDAVKNHFNIKESIRIQSLSEVLQAGNNKWSNELNQLLVIYNQSTNTASSYEEFLKGLTTFENAASKLSPSERNLVLRFIKDIRDVMQLLYENLQYYNNCCDSETMAGAWWDHWGRCAAAITGGLLTGALTGAVIGTVPVPVLGTITGAAIGGIAGALNGATSHC